MADGEHKVHGRKKVQKTKKFSLTELHLEFSKMFDLRSKPGLLEPKTDFQVFGPQTSTLLQDFF